MIALLLVVVALPLAAAATSHFSREDRAALAVRSSTVFAMALTLAVSVTAVDAELPLLAGRSLILSPIAQLGIQLLGLAMLGLVLALEDEAPELVIGWLTLAWLSVGGLVLALLISAMPLALLAFLAAAMLWAVGLPMAQRNVSSAAIMRYAALLALLLPLLLATFRIALDRTGTTLASERSVLALAVPGFGLMLGLIPLHAWALTLAAGTPRPMLFGVLTLVQTAGFVMLLRTLAVYPWLLGSAQGALVVGGVLSALLGAWFTLSARLDDPDDFLVYAVVANGGLLLAGLGARSEVAGAGVALLLFARVLALVVLALAPRAGPTLSRGAYAVGILTLAGIPGLAGFPGLWLILRRLPEGWGSPVPSLALLLAALLLFAATLRRWQADPVDGQPGRAGAPGARRAVLALCAILVVVGFAPQLIAPAFTDALRGIFFPLP